jgi:Ca2+-binding RTX toxin-like protein
LQAQHSDVGYGYGGVAGLEKQLANGGGLTSFNREQQGDVLEQYYELRTNGITEDGTISDPGVLPLFEFFVREASTIIQPTFASSHTTLNSTSNNLVLTGTDAINGTGNSLNNVIMGNSAANNLNGLDGRDWLYGGDSADKLYGMDGNDYLSGGTADDMLSGWTGDDELVGGAGKDTLLGGAGKDAFTFHTAYEGVDKILDFSVADDQLHITQAGFGKDLSVGTLPTDRFVLGASASSSKERLIYNPSTGALFFDADGNNGQQQIQIAQLSPNLALTASQISIV